MAHRIGDRVLETTAVTGTGNATLLGAISGYKTVDSLCTTNGDTMDVVIAGGTEWEVTRITRVSAGVYSRATPYSSSTGSAISFSAGTKEVWGDIAAFFAEHLNTVEITVASATTCDIGAVKGSKIEISGTTTITGFGTSAHRFRFVRFSGALTLTHNGTSLILPGAANITTAAGDTAILASDGSGNWRCYDYQKADGTALVGAAATPAHGRCLLTKVSTNLVLSPRDGNTIEINSAQQTIPDAGVSLAPPSDTITMTIASPCVVSWTNHGLVAGSPVVFATSGALPTGLTAGTVYYVISAGLTSGAFEIAATPGGSAINTTGSQSGTHKIGTLRYIYAFMNTGTMTLEASTTTYATQAGTGVKIKTGDATRSLVGMAFDRQSGSLTAWVDSATQRLTRSWFNRPAENTAMVNAFTAQRTTTSTSTSGVEINAEIRAEFLVWSTDVVEMGLATFEFNSTSNYTLSGVGWDGTISDANAWCAAFGSTGNASAITEFKAGLSEGYHYATVLGYVVGGTGSYGQSTGPYTRISGAIR